MQRKDKNWIIPQIDVNFIFKTQKLQTIHASTTQRAVFLA